MSDNHIMYLMRGGMVRGAVIGEGRGKGSPGEEEGGGSDDGGLEDERYNIVLNTTEVKIVCHSCPLNQTGQSVTLRANCSHITCMFACWLLSWLID